jgi:hypothetical protein
LWVASATYGQPAVQFDGTTFLKTAAAVDETAGSNDMTVIAVAGPQGSQPAYASIVDLSSDTAHGFVVGQLGNATNEFQLWFMDAAQTGWYSGPAVGASAGATQVISVVKNGASAAGYLNGASQGTTSVPAAMLDPIAALAVGNRASGAYGYSGQVAEVLVYNRALSDAERTSIESALEAKYINPDADGNGLPDAWESQYLGHTGNDANSDPGGAGRTLLQSHQQGLSPWPAPTVASGLRSWYRASLGVVKDGGNKVSEWTDLSGNGAHVFQSGSLEPLWVASASNSQPAMQFDGTTFLKSAAVDEQAGSNDVTIIAVAVPASTQPAYASLVDLSSDTAHGFVMGQLGGATNQYQLWFMDAAQSGWYSSPAATANAGQSEVISVVKNGATAASFLNGVAQGTSTVPASMLDPVAALAVGNRASGNYGYNGEIAEVLVYNRALSDTERQQVEAALEAEYVAGGPSGDSDGNGLPDAWEQQYFGHIGVDPNADPDGDGLTNLQEFQAGTDPTDYFNGQTPRVSIVSGNDQTSLPGTFAEQPLMVSVLNAAGTAPLVNAPVTFTVNQGGGMLAVTSSGYDPPAPTLNLKAGADGTALVYYFQPPGPGTVSQIVAASSAAQVTFAATTATLSTLYAADFESAEGYNLGSLNGQNSWSVFEGSALVTNTDSVSGTQSLALQPAPYGTYAYLPFSFNQGGPVAYVDFYAKPVAAEDLDNDVVTSFSTETTSVFFKQAGNTCQVYVYDGDGSDGLGYVGTGHALPVDGNNQTANWARITIRMDYSAERWDLYVDGHMVAADILPSATFYSQLSNFAAFSTATVPVFLDRLTVTQDNPLFADVNNDGIDDAWELAHGLSLATNNRNLTNPGGTTWLAQYLGEKKDSDGNGIDDSWEAANFGHVGVDPGADPDGDGQTNLTEYLNGTNPGVYNAPPPPSIPANLQISGLTTSTLTLSWNASQPSVGHTITGYNVYLNGSLVTQTTATSATEAYDSTGATLQFFSVSAGDNTGLTSPPSPEVLAPTPVENADVTVDYKYISAARGKKGVQGITSQKIYKTAVYSESEFDSSDISSYSSNLQMTLSIDANQDPDHAITRAVTGQISGDNNGSGFAGTWQAQLLDGNWHAVSSLDSGNVRDFPTSVNVRWGDWSADPAVTDTHGQVSYDYTDLYDPFDDPHPTHHTGSFELHLSDEYTDGDLAGVSGDYDTAKGTFDSLPWNNYSDGRPEFDASRTNFYTSDQSMLTGITLQGCQYRLHAAMAGTVHFRWAEVLYTPDGDSSQVLSTKEETVTGGPTDTYSSVYTLDPPSFPGGVRVVVISAGLDVQTPSLNPTPGSAQLFVPDAIFVGDAATLVGEGDSWNEASSAIVTFGGDADNFDLLAVDPLTVLISGMDVALAEGIPVATGANLLDGTYRGLELVALGLAPGVLIVTVHVTVSGVGYDISKTITAYPKIEIAVDTNRDGLVKFSSDDSSDATATDKPLRFWLNDDDDSHGTTLTQFGQDGTVTSITNTETAPPSQPDYAGHAIVTARNLEDFARLWIDLTGLQSMVTTSGGIQVGLKWKSFTGSPAVNLYVSADAAGSDSYLKNDQAAYTQVTDFTYSHAIAFNPTQPTLGPDGYPANQTVTTTGTFVFPLNLLQAQLQRSPVLHLLFEGAGVGTGQLVIVLLDKDGNQIGEGPGVWFDLMNIKSMYQRAKATADNTTSANGIDCTIPFPSDYTGPDNNNIPHPSMGWTANDLGYPFRPDPNEDLQHKTYIVFVHGWRQSPDRAGMFAETMFKRLWHLGYKGRFAAFRWPTFYDEFPAGLFTYNDSEYRAWKSGESLKQYVNQLPNGYVRNVVAHSMGNIVAGAAFQRGMSASNYALLNAAVPAMCYDDSASLRQPSFSYTTPNDDSDPGTKALAYIGQLKTLNTNAVNFYLTADSATSFDWELNNSQFKPQRYNGVGGYGLTGYAYDPSQSAGRRLSINFLFSLGRYLVDPHEAMPYAVQSLTKTVGADGRTGGSVNGSVNLDTWSFGSQHSAEWERNIQETRAFYSRLLSELQVLP